METYKTLIGGSAETGPSLPLHDMDTTTLLAVAVILSGAAALVMLVARLTRRTYPGFGWWTMATGCQAAGSALFGSAMQSGSWSILLLRNSLLIAGFMFLLRGMWLFRGRRVSPWVDVFVLTSFVATFGWVARDPAAFNVRVMIYSLFVGCLALATLEVLLRRRPPHFGSSDLLLASWLTAYGGVALYSGLSHLTGNLGAPIPCWTVPCRASTCWRRS